ncbi:hypothetical protein EZS27_001309 [termite gut metagenome]|uniref:Uncharacterized protein n=1 Tax=termite gut metagenome TaxID=433724 RepID=A0A5J4SYL2_9ZZZZ
MYLILTIKLHSILESTCSKNIKYFCRLQRNALTLQTTYIFNKWVNKFNFYKKVNKRCF